jgi:2-amino-4-hydroxy-6-hydroxymethyldihydropteridine diphosphokinase
VAGVVSEAILALGSNLGDRGANLQASLDLLAERGAAAVRISPVWETPPVPADQPRYLNAVALVETDHAPEELLDVAKEIERLLGRRPSGRWRPRPIDIDLLFCGEQEVGSEVLTVPHPRIAERAFVLLPLSEVVAGVLPVLGRTAGELLEGLDTGGHERTGLRLRTGS